MVKIIYKILTLVLIVICCCFSVSAAQFVITVETYDKVSVSGDMADVISATYSQTYNRKSQLTAGNSLNLKITNLPKGILQDITLSVKSNAGSGAGAMLVTLDSSPLWGIGYSEFSNWGTGKYSSEYVNINKSGEWAMAGSTLILTMEATTNSLYFSKMVLTYEPAEPQPYCVTLQERAFSGDVLTNTICETVANEGIVLPEAKEYNKEWQMVGWCLSKMNDSNTAPDMLKPNEKYYPQDNVTLYAVYSNVKKVNGIVQDTLLNDGEYIIAGMWKRETPTYYLAFGGLLNNRMLIIEGDITMEADSLYCLTMQSVPVQMKYSIKRIGDSVAIKNIDSGEKIGYSKQNKLTSNDKLWAARPTGHHTWIFHHDEDYKGDARVLYPMFEYDDDLNEYVFYKDVALTLANIRTGLILFEVSDREEQNEEAVWTIRPDLQTAVEYIALEQENSNRKKLIEGTILIIRDGVYYDLMGRRIGKRDFNNK